MKSYFYMIVIISIFNVVSAALTCSPARLTFNWAAQELRVRGIDNTRGKKTIAVRCTPDNASQAFEEMMKLSYEAILRCSSANSEPMQESAINTAEEAQVFADTAMRIASDRIGRWAQRPRSKISTFSEFLFSKSSQFMILDVAEVYINRVIAKRIPKDEYSAFLRQCKRKTKLLINDQHWLSDEEYDIE